MAGCMVKVLLLCAAFKTTDFKREPFALIPAFIVSEFFLFDPCSLERELGSGKSAQSQHERVFADPWSPRAFPFITAQRHWPPFRFSFARMFSFKLYIKCVCFECECGYFPLPSPLEFHFPYRSGILCFFHRVCLCPCSCRCLALAFAFALVSCMWSRITLCQTFAAWFPIFLSKQIGRIFVVIAFSRFVHTFLFLTCKAKSLAISLDLASLNGFWGSCFKPFTLLRVSLLLPVLILLIWVLSYLFLMRTTLYRLHFWGQCIWINVGDKKYFEANGCKMLRAHGLV